MLVFSGCKITAKPSIVCYQKPVVHLGKIYFNVVKFSVKDEQIQVLYHG